MENLIQNLKTENSKNKNDLLDLNKKKENQIDELKIKESNSKKELEVLKIQSDKKTKIIKQLEEEKNELKKNYDDTVSEKQKMEKDYLIKEENEKNFNQKLNDLESKNEKLNQENKGLNLKISELTLAINRDVGTIKQFNDLGLLKDITINNTCIQIDPKTNQFIGNNNNQGNEELEKNLDDFYDIIVNIKSVKDIAKGWEIKMTQRGEENFERYKKEELIKIGVIGNSNKGKSFILSRLSKIKLPSGTSIKTEGLSVKYPELKEFQNRKIVLLDSAGLETPVLKEDNEAINNQDIDKKEKNNDQNEENLNNINEEKDKNDNTIQNKGNNLDDYNKKSNGKEKGNGDKSNNSIFKEKSREKLITELFLQNYIIKNSDILILVVGILSYSEQKLLNRIKIEIQKLKINRPLFIIHNLKTFYTIKQVEDYIDNTLKKSATFELKQGHKITSNIKSENGVYFFEKNSNPNNIFHLIFANEGSVAGNYYNNFTLQFIENCYQNVTGLTAYNVIQTIKERFIELSKDIFEKTNENPKFQKEDIIDDEQILSSKMIKLKTPQEITLKRCLIDELGFSNLKGNGFEPNFNYYKKDNKIIIRVEAPGNSKVNSLIEYSGEYTIIRLNGEKNFDKEPKCANDNIHNTREFGHFNLDILLKTEDYLVKNQDPLIYEKKGVIMLEYKKKKKKKETVWPKDKEEEEI